MYIDKVRNYVLWQIDNIFFEEMQGEDAQKLHAKLTHFSPEDMEIIKEISTDAVDRTLFETMNMFETTEDFIIGAVNDDEIVNLNDVSDGSGGDYFGWVEEFEKSEDDDD